MFHFGLLVYIEWQYIGIYILNCIIQAVANHTWLAGVVLFYKDAVQALSVPLVQSIHPCMYIRTCVFALAYTCTCIVLHVYTQ